MRIRKAITADFDAMWEIFRDVVAAGDALPFDEDLDLETFRSHWFGTQAAYVAETDSRVVGMYKSGANHPGRGSHVASATYLVDPRMRGRGIGRKLVTHSLACARDEGFMMMQFNYVVSTNVPAVALYASLGFRIAGTLPKAFRHEALGRVDVYVMCRFLQPEEEEVSK
jgi:ribosomal protein S18 acetylase RimI-like enzyme